MREQILSGAAHGTLLDRNSGLKQGDGAIFGPISSSRYLGAPVWPAKRPVAEPVPCVRHSHIFCHPNNLHEIPKYFALGGPHNVRQRPTGRQAERKLPGTFLGLKLQEAAAQA